MRGMPYLDLPVSKAVHKTEQFFSEQHKIQAILASFDDLEALMLSWQHCFVDLHMQQDKLSAKRFFQNNFGNFRSLNNIFNKNLSSNFYYTFCTDSVVSLLLKVRPFGVGCTADSSITSLYSPILSNTSFMHTSAGPRQNLRCFFIPAQWK